jgi:enoyl-CoA hydratase/3-hydroxyacyl-CoA dehydrogenase
VLVDDVDGVKVITLRRPQAMNALDDSVTDEILDAVRAHEAEARGFVIVGYGPRAFCAGADIGRFPEVLGDATGAAQYARDCSRLLVHLDAMDKPVVAALNGMALGGGLELALRCHGIVAVDSAFLQFPEVNLGIAPGLGGMVVPYRRWPRAAAVFHDMLRLGDRLPASKAHDLGVIDALTTDPRELIRLAVARVEQLTGALAAPAEGPVTIDPLEPAEPVEGRKVALSREVVRLIERGIAEGAAAGSLADALEVGYRVFGQTACTAAATEGVGAFLERRKPDFARSG